MSEMSNEELLGQLFEGLALDSEEEEEDIIALYLTVEQGLFLQDVLSNLQKQCEFGAKNSGYLSSYGYRMVNSEIDTILSFLEEELTEVGAV